MNNEQNEQNIDDILKLLKDAFDGVDTPGDREEAKAQIPTSKRKKAAELSTDSLQEKLKTQYLVGEKEVSDDDSKSVDYIIDDDFLKDIESKPRTHDINADESGAADGDILSAVTQGSEVSADIKEENSADVELEEKEEAPAEIPADVFDDISEKANEETKDENSGDDDSLPWDDEAYEEINTEKDEETVQSLSDNYGIDISDESEADTAEKSNPDEITSGDGNIVLSKSDFNALKTYEADSDENDEAVSKEENSSLQYTPITEKTDNDAYDDGDVGTKKESVDDSVIDLMIQMGYDNELKKAVGTEAVESFRQNEAEAQAEPVDASDAFVYSGNEYASGDADQTEKIRYRYKCKRNSVLLRLAATVAVALIMLFYELLPFLGVKFEGLFDYSEVPVAYLMIDIQLTVIAAMLSARRLANGLRRAVTLQADAYSLISIGVILTVIYDIILVSDTPAEVPALFGFTVAFYLLCALVTEYLNISREISVFAIYSSDEKKYTLTDDRSTGSVADKMYRGGLDGSANVFSIKQVKSVNRYFEATNRKKNDPTVSYAVTPIIAVSVGVSVTEIMLGGSFVTSVGTLMITYLALLPLSALVSRCVPMFAASRRLKKRGCAVASEIMARKYAECNVLVFRDMHLFRPSATTDCGIVLYEKSRAIVLFYCLDALFSNLGGPLKNVFASASAGGRKHRIRIVRMARNGIEAVIDGKHSIIAGEKNFLSRYGIAFPEGEEGGNVLYTALDAKPAAKIRVKYHTEPMFERLCKVLAKNGISCAIETYDPLINGASVADARTYGSSPISVVHKNINDFYDNTEGGADFSDTGIVACASRLKLAEAAVYCKRIVKTVKVCDCLRITSYIVTFAAAILLTVFGLTESINQYYILMYQLLGCLVSIAVTAALLPSKYEFDLSDMPPAKKFSGGANKKKKKSKSR